MGKSEESPGARSDDGAPRDSTSDEGHDPPGPAVASGLSRRDFVRGGSTAMGVGAALVWSGPAIRSIRLAANAGSPTPPTTPTTPTSETVFEEGTTTPVTETASSVPAGETVSSTAAPPDTPPSSAEDTLPFTGAAIATTAAAGAGAIVAGRALMGRRRPPER